jgi:hypothetical protein
VGEVVAFADIVLRRRRRVARLAHARCLEILGDTVAAARAELGRATAEEWHVRVARLRKLEDLEAYASALG